MSSSLPSIAPLPHPTVSTLRSSTIITSLPQALTELVQNALDAQARHIVVYLDLERWGLRVEDDGTGMRKEAVEAIGSGERYGQFDKGEGRKEEDVELDERSSPFSPPPRPPSSSLKLCRDLQDIYSLISSSSVDFRIQRRRCVRAFVFHHLHLSSLVASLSSPFYLPAPFRPLRLSPRFTSFYSLPGNLLLHQGLAYFVV